MVKLNKIYTRTGDDGTTGLGTGERIAKHATRMDAIGTVDETNALIGMARLHATGELDDMLARIQNDLFDMGADLCMPDAPQPDDQQHRLQIEPAQIARIEAEIDQLNGELSPLTSFVLPGGSPISAALHAARTVARRAERILTGLASNQDEYVGTPVLQYCNRLSDFLFVAARFANDKGRQDVLWVPGQNRNN